MFIGEMMESQSARRAHPEADPVVAEMRGDFFCSMLSDVLDSLGHRQQAVGAHIRPLDESLVMVGRARTMLFADVYEPPAPGENPYELEIRLLDDLKPGDIVVSACGATGRIAPWGGLTSTASKMRGAVGALTDGFVRDIKDVRELGFPVFAAGIAPLDSRGRGKVIEIDVPVECAGVRITPGDIVFGDADGCVAIPRTLEAEVLKLGREKRVGENRSHDALLAGRLLGDVYDEFGIL